MNRKADRLLAATDHLPKGAVLVEIGCVRYDPEVKADGASTVYLAKQARKRRWDFYSIDLDPQAVADAARLTGRKGVTLACTDGQDWLEKFAGPIDFLYLDGSPSPGEAVSQYQAATFAAGATVAVDDVQDGEFENGKGHFLLDMLRNDGFTVTVFDTEPGYRMAVATS